MNKKMQKIPKILIYNKKREKTLKKLPNLQKKNIKIYKKKHKNL